MRAFNLFLANLLFLLHCLLGLIILIGWIFPQVKEVYIILLLAWLYTWILYDYCPLTKWEFLLRKKYDENIDPNAEAIKYYMYKFFKKDIKSETIFSGGIFVFIILMILVIVSDYLSMV